MSAWSCSSLSVRARRGSRATSSVTKVTAETIGAEEHRWGCGCTQGCWCAREARSARRSRASGSKTCSSMSMAQLGRRRREAIGEAAGCGGECARGAVERQGLGFWVCTCACCGGAGCRCSHAWPWHGSGEAYGCSNIQRKKQRGMGVTQLTIVHYEVDGDAPETTGGSSELGEISARGGRGSRGGRR